MPEDETDAVMGDYVLATKWPDGDPADAWAVGTYEGTHPTADPPRHMVSFGNGENARAGGYRRVGKIDARLGKWLLDSAAALERAPPGAVNLWTIVQARQAFLKESEQTAA